MLFGSKASFAIEAELLEIHGKWIYGHFRFWVDGISFGDFDDTSDLATSARWGRTFLAASARRTRGEIDQMTSHEVFELLYGRFVESVHSLVSKPWPGPWDRDPHVLDDVGEASIRDKFGVVIVRRSDGLDRILVQEFDDDQLIEAYVPAGQCDSAIDMYCSWIEEMGTGGAERPI